MPTGEIERGFFQEQDSGSQMKEAASGELAAFEGSLRT